MHMVHPHIQRGDSAEFSMRHHYDQEQRKEGNILSQHITVLFSVAPTVVVNVSSLISLIHLTELQSKPVYLFKNDPFHANLKPISSSSCEKRIMTW